MVGKKLITVLLLFALPVAADNITYSRFDNVSTGVTTAKTCGQGTFLSAVTSGGVFTCTALYATGGMSTKALTAGVATSIVRIPVAASSGTGGRLIYTVFAADAVDQQSRSGWLQFSISNKAGTEICKMTSVAGADDTSITQTEDGSGIGAISTGTLTYAVTCAVTPTNAVDFQINAVSSLTETTLNAYYKVDMAGPGQPGPQ
jgi:hypothetical protein